MNRNDYKWDGDSRDERESAFASSSFAATTGGTLHRSWAQSSAIRQRRARLAGLLKPLLIAASLSVLVLYGVVSQLRP